MLLLLFFCTLLFISVIEIFYFKNSIKNLRQYKLIYILLLIFLFFYTGFRPIGSDRDSEMYQQYFYQFQTINYKDVFFNNPHRIKEIGYVILNKLFKDLGFRALLVFVAFLSIFPKGYILFRFTNYPIFSLFLYFSFSFLIRDYTQIRDAVSVSFMLISFLAFFYKKYFLTLFSFLFATSFHYIALVEIPILFFLRFIKKERWYWVLIIISLIYYVSDFTKILYNYIYLPEQLFKYKNINGGGSFSMVFFLIAVLLIVKKYKLLKEKTYDYYLVTLLALAFGIAFFNHVALFRMTNFLLFFTILLIANMDLKKITTGSYITSISIIFAIYYFVIQIKNNIIIYIQ